MARSKVKGTNGKPRKAAPKSGKNNRASMTIKHSRYVPGVNRKNVEVELRNDGDPTSYYKGPGQPERGIDRGKKYANPVKGKGPGGVKKIKGSTMNKGTNQMVQEARKRAKNSKKKRGDNL